jgi:hypothetical protein
MKSSCRALHNAHIFNCKNASFWKKTIHEERTRTRVRSSWFSFPYIHDFTRSRARPASKHHLTQDCVSKKETNLRKLSLDVESDHDLLVSRSWGGRHTRYRYTLIWFSALPVDILTWIVTLILKCYQLTQEWKKSVNYQSFNFTTI